METALKKNTNQLMVMLGICAFVIAEPVLSIYGKTPGIFIFYGADSVIYSMLFALIVVLAPPAILALICAIAGSISDRVGSLALSTAIFALAFLWMVQLLRWSVNLDHSIVLSAVSILAAGIFVAAFWKYKTLKDLALIAAGASLILIAVFAYQLRSAGLFETAEDSNTNIGPSTDQPDLPSILFVILDEFPTVLLLDEQNDLDRSLFPNLASLADEGTWYKRFSVMASQTYNSVPSILSGIEPKNASPTSKHFPNNLFTLFEPTHNLVALESITKLCAAEKCNARLELGDEGARFTELLATAYETWTSRVSLGERPTISLDTYIETTTAKTPKPAAEKPDPRRIFDPKYQIELAKNRPKRLEQFVNSISKDASPSVYFLHLQLPHSPWRFYPDGELYSVPRARNIIASYNEVEWLRKVAELRLSMQAQYTDRLMGELFLKLKEESLWDDTLIIVTSDHGRSLLPNTATRSLTDAFSHVGYVPLFVKSPGQKRATVDKSNTLSVDLLPSIASITGVAFNGQTDGFAFGSENISGRGERKAYFPLDVEKPSFPLKISAKKYVSDDAHYPKYASRSLPGASDTLEALSQLNAELSLSKYIGKNVSSFAIQQGGSVTVDDLEAAEEQTEGRPPLGMIFGSLDEDATNDKILIAVNERFISGSPVFSFGKDKKAFLAVLPQGTLQGKNKIEIYQLRGNSLYRLSKTPG